MITRTQARELPRAIVIVGDGQVGVLTAIALRRALPTTVITVTPAPRDVAAFADTIGTAMPYTNRLHDQLGIAEMDLVRKAGASHRLVTRYRGWSTPGHDAVCDYGDGAQSLGNAFTGMFDGVQGSGGEADALIMSPAMALAATGRFCSPEDSADFALADVDYALRWNVAAYRQVLIDHAMRLGVQYAPQLPTDVQRNEQGDIAAIVLQDDGGVLPGDMFVDCSGPARWLISHMEDSVFDSWAAHLPCDRVLIAAPGDAVLALEDRVTLTAYGWLAEIGGRDGVQRLMAFPSTLAGDAVDAVLMQAGVTSAIGATLVPGALAQPFVGNVIALGDAAASFEPMGGANLDLAHRQLSLFLELMPGRTIEPRERDEYNRRASLMAIAMRTWLASHYLAPGQPGTPFADHVRQLTRSPELSRLADQYNRHCRLPFIEEAPMLPSEWSGLLRAVGVPSSPSAHALAKPADITRAMMQKAARAAEAAVAVAPPYGEWMMSALNGAA